MKEKASFFIWDYTFLDDRIIINRDFVFSRSNIIYTDKIEAVSTVTSIIMNAFGRCNIIITFAGNIFTLFGVPKIVADKFVANYSDDDGHVDKIKLSTVDLMKKSLLQSHYEWYTVILLLLWAAVFLFSSPIFNESTARLISDFIFRHMLVAGTFVLSIGLPYTIILLWALTGGFLREYLKYYKFTVSAGKKIIYYESGLLVRRKMYIMRDRIAIVEYKQTPLMRIFGFGKLYVRAVGYNPVFVKSKPILPLLRESDMLSFTKLLLPDMNMSHRAPRRRSFHYYLFTTKMIIPIVSLVLGVIFGKSWFVIAAISLMIVIASCFLEYKNSYFESNSERTVLSKGGFFRTAACISTDKIELIAKSGSRLKLSRGYTNVVVHVFGKRGCYAFVKNIDLRQLDHYHFDSSGKGL